MELCSYFWCFIASSQTSANNNDKNAFQLAIEKPNNDQEISSHLIIGAFIIFASNSVVERLLISADVQLWGPNHHFFSIPEWYTPKALANTFVSDPITNSWFFGFISQSKLTNIAKPWGHRCHIQILHGVYPKNWKIKAVISSEVEPNRAKVMIDRCVKLVLLIQSRL